MSPEVLMDVRIAFDTLVLTLATLVGTAALDALPAVRRFLVRQVRRTLPL